MKIIKGLFTIIFLCVLIISCKETNKEEQSEAMEATKTEAEAPEEKTEMKSEENTEEASETEEMAGYSYTVNYPKDIELAGEVDATIKFLSEKYPGLESNFMNAYGYVIFPKITKAGLGIGEDRV